MKRNTEKEAYEKHLAEWNRSRKLVREYNEKLISEWWSIPWWKFWVYKPSFEEQRQIVIDNWTKFNCLPKPRLADYFPINI